MGKRRQVHWILKTTTLAITGWRYVKFSNLEEIYNG